MIGLAGNAWPEALRAPLEVIRKEREARTPAWLEGKFRPRNLTAGGRDFLERLNPSVVAKEGPVGLLHQEPWNSLRDRMDYLQRKYLALDMVRKGFAVEVDGCFWPYDLRFEAQKVESASRVRRRNGQQEPPLSHQELMVWLGAFREASWDQVRSLHPPFQEGIDLLVETMIERGAAERRRVQFGQGTLSTVRLSDLGLCQLKSLQEGPDLLQRGFGHRPTGPGWGEFHEQAVGDGIGYFCHELQASQSEITGITLDAGLRREYLGAPHIPDFRVEFKNDLGSAHWDIEVIGIGRRYRNTGDQAGKTASVTVRGFDPMGRSAASRAKDVGVRR